MMVVLGAGEEAVLRRVSRRSVAVVEALTTMEG